MKSTVFFTAVPSAAKSRSDDTLLTGGFNCRTTRQRTQRQSRAATTLEDGNVPSLRDWAEYTSCSPRRRLKSTVNRVSSLRDCSSLVANGQVHSEFIRSDHRNGQIHSKFIHSDHRNGQTTPSLFIPTIGTDKFTPSLFVPTIGTGKLPQVCSFRLSERANYPNFVHSDYRNGQIHSEFIHSDHRNGQITPSLFIIHKKINKST